MGFNRYTALYAQFLRRHLNLKRPLKVVFDASNGSSGLLFRAVAAGNRKLAVTFLNDHPDGDFPAHGPDPLRPGATDQLAAAVREQEADAGVILDNDGDRAFFVDTTGRLLTATETLIFIGRQFSGPVVVDFMIGPLAYQYFRRLKRRVITSRVGLYFIKQAIIRHGAQFAGEYSGHYYFKQLNGSDCGVMAAVLFFNQLSTMGQSLNSWLATLPRYHQTMVNFPYPREQFPALAQKLERRFQRSARKISKLDGIKIELATHWFNLRPSNTEDLIRLTVEASSEKVLQSATAKLTALF